MMLTTEPWYWQKTSHDNMRRLHKIKGSTKTSCMIIQVLLEILNAKEFFDLAILPDANLKGELWKVQFM